MNSRHNTFWPSISVVICGALWGLYWIPLRELDRNGIDPAWSTFLSLGVLGIISIAVFFVQWVRKNRIPWGIIFTGICSGTSVMLYAAGVGLTEIVKVVLLFYLMPVWSALLGKLILKESINKFRVAAIVLGLAGMAVILGITDGMPKLSNWGDALALLSGMIWAYAAVRIRRDHEAKVWEQVGAFYIGALLASTFFIVLPTGLFESAPSLEEVRMALGWLLVFIVVYLPSMFFLFWSTQRISPTRVGILLMSEIIFGVVSAALLSNEPFGWIQGIGVVLIVSAAIVDTLAQQDLHSETDRVTSN